MKFFALILLLQTIAFAANEATKTTASNDLFNPATILAATVSIITLVGFIGSAGKKLLAAAHLEDQVKDLRAEVDTIKSDRDNHAKVLDELFEKIKDEIQNKASVEIYSDLEELETKVGDELDKLKGTVSELSQVEYKLNELKEHFDESNADRREEIKELTDTVKGLRDNMREDVNDVKSIIMKLMMNLKINDD
jgi:phage shock protein A